MKRTISEVDFQDAFASKKIFTTQGEKNQDKCKQILQLQKNTAKYTHRTIHVVIKVISPCIQLYVYSYSFTYLLFRSLSYLFCICNNNQHNNTYSSDNTLIPPSSFKQIKESNRHETRVSINFDNSFCKLCVK